MGAGSRVYIIHICGRCMAWCFNNRLLRHVARSAPINSSPTDLVYLCLVTSGSPSSAVWGFSDGGGGGIVVVISNTKRSYLCLPGGAPGFGVGSWYSLSLGYFFGDYYSIGWCVLWFCFESPTCVHEKTTNSSQQRVP